MRTPYRLPFPPGIGGDFTDIAVTGIATIQTLGVAGAATFVSPSLTGNLTFVAGGTITTSTNGDLKLIPHGTGMTIVGDAGSVQFGISGNDALFVTGNLEVRSRAYFPGAITVASEVLLHTATALTLGTGGESHLEWSLEQSSAYAIVWGFGQTSKTLILTTHDNFDRNHGHQNQANPTLYIHSAYNPETSATRWIGLSHNNTNAAYTRGTGVHLFDAVIRFNSSLYYSDRHTEVFSVSAGGSGATFVPPDANTLGGYQLDANTEFLYFSSDINADWDAATDLEVLVTFEVNVDNSGGSGGDTVDLKLVCYYKGDSETANKTQTVEVATVVDQSPQYKQFTVTFTINHDLVDHVAQIGDKLSFILNLETDTSEVDNVIINHCHARYKSAKICSEV